MGIGRQFALGAVFSFVNRGGPAMRSATGDVRDFKKGILDSAASAEVFGMSAAQAIAVGTALAATGALALRSLNELTKSALPLEKQIAQVTTLLEDEERALLSTASMMQFATTSAARYGVTSEEIAKGLFQAKSAGVEAAEVFGVVDAAIQGARAGGASLEVTLGGVAAALNGLGLEAEDGGSKVAGTRRVLDELFLANKFGVTTFEELAASLGRVAPIAGNLEVRNREVLASLAALTFGGQKTSEAATGIAAAMNAVLGPSVEAKRVARELGIEFSADALRAKGLANFLFEVVGAADGNSEALKRLFGSVEALKAVLALTSEQGGGKFLDVLDAMEASAGTVDKAFGDVAGTAAFQAERLTEAWKSFAESISTTVLPLRASFTGFLADMLEGITAWVNENPGFVRGLVAVASALASMLVVLGGVLAAAGAYVGAKAVIATFGTTVAAVAATIGVAMAKILAVIAAVVLAVTAMTYVWSTNLGGIRDRVTAWGAGLAAWWGGFWTSLTAAFEPALGALAFAWDEIRLSLDAFLASILPRIGLSTEGMRSFGEVAGWVAGTVLKVLAYAISGVAIGLSIAIKTIADLIGWLKELHDLVVGGVVGALTTAFDFYFGGRERPRPVAAANEAPPGFSPSSDVAAAATNAETARANQGGSTTVKVGGSVAQPIRLEIGGREIAETVAEIRLEELERTGEADTETRSRVAAGGF